jgi:hypothetical protein
VQPRALGRKASDEFAVPLCRSHHRAVHRAGDEEAWWKQAGIDPINAARKLWNTRIDEGRIEAEPTAQLATSDRTANSDEQAVSSQAPTARPAAARHSSLDGTTPDQAYFTPLPLRWEA